jgi:hypothetical protein
LPRDPGVRLRGIAAGPGITERSACGTVTGLTAASRTCRVTAVAASGIPPGTQITGEPGHAQQGVAERGQADGRSAAAAGQQRGSADRPDLAAGRRRQPGAVAAQHLCRDTARPGHHHRAGYPSHADDHPGAAGDLRLNKDPW